MRPASLDEIFADGGKNTEGHSGELTSVAGVDEIFGSSALSPEPDDGFDAFAQENALEQKTRADVVSEGIDTTPMLSVAQIREKFSKGNGPVFPKQVSGYRTTKAAGNFEIESRPNETPSRFRASTGPGTANKSSSESERNDTLSTEEFSKISAVHGCVDAIKYYSDPRDIHILIRPEDGRPPLLKRMRLQFNAEQRLLVMLRKETTRYIRLNDVIRIDATPECLAAFEPSQIPQEVNNQCCIALYFRTAKHPMVIASATLDEKDKLLKLIMFLRQLLKTDAPLEISV